MENFFPPFLILIYWLKYYNLHVNIHRILICELKKICYSKPNLKIIKTHNLQETLNNDYKISGKLLTKNDRVKDEHIKYVEKL